MNTKLIILDWAGTAVDSGCFAPVGAFALAFRSAGKIRRRAGRSGGRNHLRRV